MLPCALREPRVVVTRAPILTTGWLFDKSALGATLAFFPRALGRPGMTVFCTPWFATFGRLGGLTLAAHSTILP